jgi:hypothetical protein
MKKIMIVIKIKTKKIMLNKKQEFSRLIQINKKKGIYHCFLGVQMHLTIITELLISILVIRIFKLIYLKI